MRLTGVLALVLTLSSCGMPFMGRAKAPPPPPGPTPARIPDQVDVAATAKPGTSTLPTPPALATELPDTAGPATASQVSIPKAPPPRTARQKRVAKRAPAPISTVESSEAPAAPAATAPPPVYRLGELRSPVEKEKLRQQSEQLLGVCSAALAAADGKSLTTAQTEMVNRVKMFAQQAREAMDKDPGEARSFAAKGKTFAEALLAELK